MEGKRIRDAGVPDEASLLGQRNLAMLSLSCARNHAPQIVSFSYLPHGELGLANLRQSFAADLSSLGFQTCRIADSPNSAGREAALEVGLETCAATVRRRDLTYNLSLSFVASCHR
jgi:hypothetical protein